MKKLLVHYLFTISLLTIAMFLQADLTDIEKHNLVQKSAPLFKFHPKDDSSLASADWYIPRCSLEVLKPNGSKEILAAVGSLTPESLAILLKKYKENLPGEFFLNPGGGKQPGHKNTLKGPGYIRNASDQHAYYNLVEISDTYVKISYWFFCPYQGNIDILPGVNIVIDQLKAGSHEGDWEHIDVRWEKNNNTWNIRDVFFARHGQAKGDLVKKEDVQFVNDQMKSDKNSTHPVVYVAMNSHGTYPKNIFFLSADADKTSDKGPIAFLYGKDNAGKWKLEDYNKQPWRPYIFRWGADLTKKLGGSPETPHAYGSFGRGKKSSAELIVNNKAAWKLDIKNGKSPYFKIDPRARIKQIDFKLIGLLPSKAVEFEIWKRSYLGLGDKKLYGPFHLNAVAPSKDNPNPSANATNPVSANYSDTLYIKTTQTSPAKNFGMEVELIE